MDEISEEHLSATVKAFAESTATSQPIRLCDFCRKDSWKYRCPRCSFRTCSLLCSKEHKTKYDVSFQVLALFQGWSYHSFFDKLLWWISFVLNCSDKSHFFKITCSFLCCQLMRKVSIYF